MLEATARSLIVTALVLVGVALAWLVIDLLFASPAVLVFAEIAIICAVLSPFVCLLGWIIRWIGGFARA